LLDFGAKIDDGDNNGVTPIFYAMQSEKLDCVELFIERGANLSLTDLRGRTPLHWAAMKNWVEIAIIPLARPYLDFRTADGDTYVTSD